MQQSNVGHIPFWARSLNDPTFFSEEQAQLGEIWTLVGLTTDIPQDGDWFRASLGSRSIFVQRFGDTVRGFENLCAHRFYPLRTKDKGHGPIRCGFHHWQYNKDGLAVGIPKCQELFGKSPRELDARLTRLEIATCGVLIFGRFPSAEHTDSLEEYLGEGFAILQAMWSLKGVPDRNSMQIAANWKLCFHITLDDYHIVAVHPSTFGKNGYLPLNVVQYYRFGRHSAYLYGGGEGELSRMATQCRAGTYRPSEYRIWQFFPNLLAVHFRADRTWYVLIQQYLPIAHNRTQLRSWYAKAPFPPADRNWTGRLRRKLTEPWLPLFVPYYMRKIAGEDNTICEHVQRVAPQISARPILGRHEERIGWFEEAYAQVVADTDAPTLASGNIVRAD
jgi:phenylpropionate dioxygenase-like ring-hydroxylating dioxygenase large terminal subunit